MNFNYDLATWIDYFIGAFICCFGALLAGSIILNKKIKNIEARRLLLLVPVTFFTIFNTLAFDNILKLFGSLIVVFLINKYIIDEKNIKIFLYSVITYISIVLGEVIYVFSVSFIDYVFKFSLVAGITKTITTNVMIAIISCMMAYLLKKIVVPYIDKIQKNNILIMGLQGLLTVFIIIASVNYIYIEKWHFSYKFILVAITVLGSTYLTFGLMKQFIKSKEVENKYDMLQDYLKTSAYLIEKYSSAVHKYKNNLIIIKGYLKSDFSEANNYIDSLLENIENKKYTWVKQINYIPIDTIRYMIYYKLSKAEEKNLKIFVNVSKNVEKIDIKMIKSNELGYLLDILGEYFDNAIYASNESKEKKINFDLYTSGNELVINISNTYKGLVDLNLITKNGYTTKGKGHGLGLYDIDKTIKSIKIFSNNYEIIDNYFVTTLKVMLKEK